MAELVTVDRETVAAFIAAERDKPWAPGSVDCCMVLASWAMWLGHPDPVAEYRGAYSDEAGLNALIDGRGGVLPFVADAVARIGGTRLERARCGAVGVLGSKSNPRRQFGAIHDGKSWRVRMINDYGAMCAAPLAVWDIGKVAR
ncbi:MAG: hypothetical protein H5U22_01745 [Rhizobium sp.]|nr:hypothetical protein [Rhizobium sp.]